ncbi:MAG: hypothetical protein Q9179_004623 [Wetmoreana sp. 5 TL-2023]
MDPSLLPADFPMLPPPPGRTSNFVDPESQANVVLSVCSVALALMVVFGSLRIYVRLSVAHTFSKDDSFVVLFYMACLLVEVISCTPWPGQTWLEASLSKRCGRDLVLGYVMAAVNVVSDFYLLAIPIPVVWNLQMPLKRKIGVSAIFLTGFMACICSTINTYFRVHAAASPDVIWNITPVVITSIVEFRSALGALSLKSLKRKLVYPWSKCFTSDTSETYQEVCLVAPSARQDKYLETGILGSMQGKGKFLDSKVYTQRQRMERQQNDTSTTGVATIRDVWND